MRYISNDIIYLDIRFLRFNQTTARVQELIYLFQDFMDEVDKYKKVQRNFNIDLLESKPKEYILFSNIHGKYMKKLIMY